MKKKNNNTIWIDRKNKDLNKWVFFLCIGGGGNKIIGVGGGGGGGGGGTGQTPTQRVCKVNYDWLELGSVELEMVYTHS